jgi:hypothetical protein
MHLITGITVKQKGSVESRQHRIHCNNDMEKGVKNERTNL